MYFLHAINSDRQTRLLNVLGQIAMILGDKKKTRKLTILAEFRYILTRKSSFVPKTFYFLRRTDQM